MITHHKAEPCNPARSVLLGAHGFIGAAIRKQLEMKGIPLLALTSADLDLTDVSAADKLTALLDPADTVIMLAAITPDKGRDFATLMKNLLMMQAVCSAIDRAKCKHLVYFSSDAVYDPAVSCISERTSPSPQDLYGVMHYTREIMARSLHALPVLVLRPTLVYGLNDPHNSYGPNRFRRAAKENGRITLFGEGEEMRDHIHVDDVAALTVRCLERKSSGTLNIATGTSKSFHEIATIVARQFDHAVEIISNPRTTPITHRHFDVTDLIKAFPDVKLTSLEHGLLHSAKAN